MNSKFEYAALNMINITKSFQGEHGLAFCESEHAILLSTHLLTRDKDISQYLFRNIRSKKVHP
jgi:hypothetical protein